MNLANQNKIISQRKTVKGLLMALFLVCGFLFFQVREAKAADSNCLCYSGSTANMNSAGAATFKKSGEPFSVTNVTACQTKCGMDGANAYCFNTDPANFTIGCVVTTNVLTSSQSTGSTFATVVTNSDPAANLSKTGKMNGSETVEDVCSAGGALVKGDFSEAFKCLFYGVLKGLGWLLGLVATIFQWVVEPANISGPSGLLEQPTVKNVWIMVRDTLNLTFIMILLFASFCTVFQVESWNLKKVWLNILINALLVNFSFPIARIFIDISNVAMYYFLNHLFTGTGAGSGQAIMSSFSEQAKISVILTPSSYASATLTYILASIVFTFILGITLLVLAVLFLIRLVALTMLLMFSPVGFVGYIFPGTSKFASDWWSQLFKYAFFGPVMVFMMMVALAIMKATPDTFTQAATGNTSPVFGVDANWLGSAAFFSIPIIILWTAMGIAQKMGVEGASAVVGQGQKFAKWAGSSLTTRPAGAIMGGIKKGAGALAKGGVNKFDRDVLKSWSPRALKAGWDARSKDIENKHMSVASGTWHDRLNKFYGDGKTNYRELAEHQIIAKRQKELIDGGVEESEDEFLQMGKLIGKKTKTAQVDLQAMMRNQIARNDHNDFMGWIQENVDGNTELGKQFIAMGINKSNYEIENGDIAHAMDKILEASGVDEEHRNTHLQDVGSIAVSKGGIMYGTTKVDAKTGKRIQTYKVSKDANGVDNKIDAGWTSDIAVRKLMTTPDAQNVPKSLHPNYSSNRAKGGTASMLPKQGEALLRRYASPSAIKQVDRFKPEYVEQIGNDDGIASQQFKYAKKMGTTGVDGYDNDGNVINFKNADKMIQGAAWVVALQKRAGKSQAKIDSMLNAAHFTPAEIIDINTMAK